MRITPSRLAAFCAASALLTLGFGIAPASAATVAVGNDTALISATSNPAIDVIELGADITVADDELTPQYNVTLDLKGWDLITANITIPAGVTLTIVDTSILQTGSLTSTAFLPAGRAGITVNGTLQIGTATVYGGTVTATGNCTLPLLTCGAGIGGNVGEAHGTITIFSGFVTGIGGGQGSSLEGGAGIGGGWNPSTAGGAITIHDGTVIADGGSSSAGITSRWGGGLVTINGGTVTADGGEYGAGIGGGIYQGAGEIDINGGAVTTTAGAYAAGIGGGSEGTGGTISIDNATVNSNGGILGSGIGGGYTGFPIGLNYGANVWIGVGSTVTTPSIRAVGPANQSTTQVGLLTINGELTIPSGGALDIPAGATGKVGPTGLVKGAGTVGGLGSITNNGIIQNATVTTATITDHNYTVTFDSNAAGATPATQTVKVYAPTMVAGDRALPPDPNNPAGTFIQWRTTATGTTAFTTSAPLSGDTTAYASYIPIHLVVSPATPSVTSGAATVFTVEGFDSINISLGDYTSLVTFTTSNPGADTVTGNSITFGPAGTTTVTATLNTDSSITGDATATVAHGSVAGAVLTLSSLSVAQGGSINYTVEARDAYGNTWPAGSIVTSSVSTDVITGTTITFPHASPHVITANIPGFSASATVEVTPYGLAVTGFIYDTALPIYAVGTGLAGILLLLIAARRRERTAA